jgi:hypothetical protein
MAEDGIRWGHCPFGITSKGSIGAATANIIDETQASKNQGLNDGFNQEI